MSSMQSYAVGSCALQNVPAKASVGELA